MLDQTQNPPGQVKPPNSPEESTTYPLSELGRRFRLRIISRGDDVIKDIQDLDDEQLGLALIRKFPELSEAVDLKESRTLKKIRETYAPQELKTTRYQKKLAEALQPTEGKVQKGLSAEQRIAGKIPIDVDRLYEAMLNESKGQGDIIQDFLDQHDEAVGIDKEGRRGLTALGIDPLGGWKPEALRPILKDLATRARLAGQKTFPQDVKASYYMLADAYSIGGIPLAKAISEQIGSEHKSITSTLHDITDEEKRSVNRARLEAAFQTGLYESLAAEDQTLKNILNILNPLVNPLLDDPSKSLIPGAGEAKKALESNAPDVQELKSKESIGQATAHAIPGLALTLPRMLAAGQAGGMVGEMTKIGPVLGGMLGLQADTAIGNIDKPLTEQAKHQLMTAALNGSMMAAPIAAAILAKQGIHVSRAAVLAGSAGAGAVGMPIARAAFDLNATRNQLIADSLLGGMLPLGFAAVHYGQSRLAQSKPRMLDRALYDQQAGPPMGQLPEPKFNIKEFHFDKIGEQRSKDQIPLFDVVAKQTLQQATSEAKPFSPEMIFPLPGNSTPLEVVDIHSTTPRVVSYPVSEAEARFHHQNLKTYASSEEFKLLPDYKKAIIRDEVSRLGRELLMEPEVVGMTTEELVGAQKKLEGTPEPEMVRAARERMKGKRLSGVDSDSLLVAGYDLYKVGMRFVEWSAEMVKQFGEEVRPQLEGLFGKVKGIWQAEHLNDKLIALAESKVKYENGDPIPVYHGSPHGVEIKEVDFGKLNPDDWIQGFFTTQAAEVTSGYAKGSGRRSLTEQEVNDLIKQKAVEHGVDVEELRNVHRELVAGRWGYGDMVKDLPTPETVKIQRAALQVHNAQIAGKAPNPNVHKFYLDIRNPLDLDAPADPQLLTLLQQTPEDLFSFANPRPAALETNQDILAAAANRFGGNEGARKWLMSQGFDGATHLGGKTKTFTDRAEAEREARRTGGKITRDITIDTDSMRSQYPNLANLFDTLNNEYEITYPAKQSVMNDLYAGKYPKTGWTLINRAIDDGMKGAPFDKFVEEAKALRNLPEHSVYEVKGHRVWIAFDPSQVISATGTDSFQNLGAYIKAKSRLLEVDQRLSTLRQSPTTPPPVEPEGGQGGKFSISQFSDWLSNSARPRAVVKIPASTPQMPVLYTNQFAQRLFWQAWQRAYPESQASGRNPMALPTEALPKVIGELYDEISRHPVNSTSRVELEGLVGVIGYIWATRPTKGGSFSMIPVLDGKGLGELLKMRRHEFLHQEQFSLTGRLNRPLQDIYKLTDPGFLATHPLAEKILSVGGPRILDNYDPTAWTAEVVAFATSGDGHLLGLTPGESAQFIQDYKLHLQAKYGEQIGKDLLKRPAPEVARIIATESIREARRGPCNL